MKNSASWRLPVSSVLLVDGHSLAFRAYYAFAKSRDGGLRTASGVPTSVCFGFLRSLFDTLATHRPEAVAIAFDTSTPTFRHDADANYKANRRETPEDFLPDVENLRALLDAFGFSVITAPGYEADDIIGTLAHQARDRQQAVKILSGDRDLFQLVSDDARTTMLYLAGGYGRKNTRPVEFHPEDVRDKLGVPPEQVVDYKALCGDASDNLPGVKGIGEKTAVKLLREYGSLDGIYENIDRIKGATRKKLEAGKDEAYRTQYMAQILCEVPLDRSLDRFTLSGFNEAQVAPLLKELELQSLLNSLGELQERLGGDASANSEAATPNAPEPTSNSASEATQDDEDDDLWFFSAEDTETSDRPQNARLQPQIIDRPERLHQLVERLKQHTDPSRPVAWDTETTSTKPTEAELVGIGCCWGDEPDAIAYIPLKHRSSRRNAQLSQAEVLDALRPILERDDYPKALQNAKYDRLVFRTQGVRLAGVVFDTLLASYLLNPETTHNLTDLALRHLDLTVPSYKDLVPKGQTIADISVDAVADYCGHDVHVTYRLVPILRSQLADVPELQNLFENVELPLEAVLAEMEHWGICIDVDYLRELSEKLATELDRIEARAYELAGETFNLGSPKQLSQLLFETLGLDKRKSSKTKTGYSTNAAALDKLQGDHPIVDCILEHRTLSKLKSTYVDALPELAIAESSQSESENTDANTSPNPDTPQAKLDAIQSEVNDLAGNPVNLDSTAQLSEFLFDTLGLDSSKSKPLKTGYSTSQSVLKRLKNDHPIVSKILDYRDLKRQLQSSDGEANETPDRSLQDDPSDTTYRIHTDFNQAITATGRLSSSNPNLQNIPIRTEFSRQIRKAFVPRKDWLLVAADYSQIELRILAHLSQEPTLVDAYQNGRDVHRLTAQLLFEKDEISADERRLGKTINFGVIYGMGAHRFAREAGVKAVEGREFIDRYNDRYANVFAYLQQMKREAIARGYVETICGRRRYFNFESGSLRRLQGSDPQDIDLDALKKMSFNDAQALRAAANAPIQGSSADIIKIAMVNLHELLRDREARILLQVHDELVFEMPESEWQDLASSLKQVMESAVTLSVPLQVEIHSGRNWMETK